jgi:hypothetical protein
MNMTIDAAKMAKQHVLGDNIRAKTSPFKYSTPRIPN